MFEELKDLGRTPTGGRFVLFPVVELADLNRLHTDSRHFALFTALDTSSFAEGSMVAVADKLLRSGLGYACCWGPDCERFHDAIDSAVVENDFYGSDNDVVMTTWHSEDTLMEALSFFANSAYPTDQFGEDCLYYVIAASLDYIEKIRAVTPKALRF